MIYKIATPKKCTKVRMDTFVNTIILLKREKTLQNYFFVKQTNGSECQFMTDDKNRMNVEDSEKIWI